VLDYVGRYGLTVSVTVTRLGLSESGDFLARRERPPESAIDRPWLVLPPCTRLAPSAVE
jgi:hypothetical protein